MKFSKKMLFFSILSIFISSVSYGSNFDISLQNKLDEWRVKNKVVGVVMLISSPSLHTVLTSGTTKINNKTLISSETLFGVGSITKTFVSVMILRLQSEGKIDLNDKVVKYFPQYHNWRDVTIKQLLNMTSGIADYLKDNEYNNDIDNKFEISWTTDKLINIAYRHANYFQPGHGWDYSNTNYLLLGKIIEKITEKPLADIFDEQFFRPLNLKHTYYSEAMYLRNGVSRMAHGYYNHKDMIVMVPKNLGLADGGMIMSAADLEIWIKHLFIKQDVLPKAQLAEVLTTVQVTNVPLYPANTGYGLGVLVSKDKKLGDMIWYTGVIPGYTSSFLWLPNFKTLIIAEASLNQKNEENFNVLFPNRDLFINIIDKVIKNTVESIS